MGHVFATHNIFQTLKLTTTSLTLCVIWFLLPKSQFVFATSLPLREDRFGFEPLRISEPRSALAATSVGNLALFAGGIFGTTVSAVVDIYNSSSGVWSTATLSQARNKLAATSVSGLALFAGGLGSTAASAVVDIFDYFSNSWTSTAFSTSLFSHFHIGWKSGHLCRWPAL